MHAELCFKLCLLQARFESTVLKLCSFLDWELVLRSRLLQAALHRWDSRGAVADRFGVRSPSSEVLFYVGLKTVRPEAR